jgi:hypothetical protein
VPTPGYDMVYSDKSPESLNGQLETTLNREQAEYYIINQLNWALHKANNKASIVTEVKTKPRTSFYYRGHGIGSDGIVSNWELSTETEERIGKYFSGMYIKYTFGDDESIFPQDLSPAFCTYTFVFINACWSGLDPGAKAFQTIFSNGGQKETTYMGWNSRVTSYGASFFASLFYEACNISNVEDASRTALETGRINCPLYFSGLLGLVFLGDKTISIDTTQ